MGIRLLNPINPICKVLRDTDQVVTTATVTAMSFDTDVYGGANGFWTIGDPTKLYAPVSGIYLVVGTGGFEAHSTGGRQFWLRKNGAGDYPCEVSNKTRDDGGQWHTTISATVDLQAGDYMEIYVYQNTGGNLNLEGTAPNNPSFSMALISDLNVP